LPGGDLDGITEVIAFCRAVRRHVAEDGPAPVAAGERLVVLGGGKPALLAARAARRLGAAAAVVHPVPLERWPADGAAIEAAREEGVELLAAHRVTGLVGEGALTAVKLQPVVAGPPDAVGRSPLRNRGQAEQLAANVLVAAGDRAPAAEALPPIDSLARGPRGNLVVDARYRLGEPGWYAAGEVATGAASLVDSMATGRRAAEAIAADLATAGDGGTR
jgi:glutamate synthase (NADPH/NADH) small chain